MVEDVVYIISEFNKEFTWKRIKNEDPKEIDSNLIIDTGLDIIGKHIKKKHELRE